LLPPQKQIQIIAFHLPWVGEAGGRLETNIAPHFTSVALATKDAHEIDTGH